MLLTLEVISPNGEALGANRQKTVGPEGAQIGRSKENDWVINDPYISRVNARIRYVSGAFYIEGMGRNPLALNDAANVLANNEPQLLRSGDRFFLDQYEIRATIAAARSSTGVHDDPFSADATASPRVPDVWAGGSSPLPVDIRDGQVDDAGNLDPLAALGGSAPRTPPSPRHVDLDQRSVLEDSFQAPRPVAPQTGPAADPIPDTWDRSRTKMESPPPAPRVPGRTPAAPPPTRNVAPPATGIPDAWDRTNMPLAGASAPARPVRPEPPPPQRKPAVSHTVRRAVEAPPAIEVMRPAPPPVAEARSAQQGQGGSSLSLEQLLQAAGVPATHMAPELAAELGQVLRIVVQGVMEVLQSRAEIKSQLRMSMTRMQPTENNPLKFSPNVEAALHTLLVERNRGYLPTTRAFEEALLDIRNHQIAVLQGIRVAFDSMLENFDPERIEADMDRGSKRGGLLNVGAKSRFRDHYIEQFEKLTKDPDESFRRLFGEHFAQAYEDQMDRLKATARTSGA